uniref:Tripartite motif-containing protein 3 n=1 Tax=Magallana gigas TaxID=29159 RepID=K1QI68_MAGGI
METASIPCKVHQCSKCPGDTEYYCVSCPCDLCPQCKENHVKDLQTIDHDVVSHRDKINYIPTQDICVRHPSHVYTKYCEPCQVPVCNSCSEHKSHRFPIPLFGKRRHKIKGIKGAYQTKRQQHRGTIHTISEALFYRPVLLPRIKTDFKTCRTEFSLYQSEMLTRAQTLKHLINYIHKDFMCNVFCDFDFKHRCLKHKKEMTRHIVSLQEYELRYVQPEFIFSALQFLSSIKKALPQIHPTLHTSQLSMTESLNKEDVMESLSAIQITERGNRRVGNQCLLKLTSGAELHQSLTVTGVDCCLHISCVTSDLVWVSDGNKIILTHTTGVPLHRVKNSCSGDTGLHTVNSESELIYIDRNENINKLSKDMKTTTTFIETTDSTWRPQCVYWSPSTGDLLVGMRYIHTDTGKVTRYNQSGHLTQTIQHDNTGQGLYRKPNYITENNNGDVVVSDRRAVVVTEHGGRHRFSYRGPPSGLGLRPRGICTDALSHILVYDGVTNTVQMLDKDGQFLFHLLIRPSGIFSLRSLSYDVNTHRLWVGSEDNNKVCVYRYITRQDALTDQSRVMKSLSEITTPGTEKPQQGNQCLLKLMSPPELLHSLTLTDTSKVIRYNQSGQLTQTIQHDNTGQGLYSKPNYITENNNGDVVVSVSSAVVVTERGGRYRFSYRGHLSESVLRPRGICTDALSHILVCDVEAKTVQMLDKDGQFLSHLMTESQEMGEPWSLSYDVNTHRLWVGSGSRDNNKVCVYRYITRQDALTDEHRPRPDGEAMFSSSAVVTFLKSQTNVLKDKLEQKRLVCCQMKNEIDQIQVTHPTLTVSHHSASTPSHARTVFDPSTVTLHRPSIQVFISLHTVRPICLPALLRDPSLIGASPYHSLGGASRGYHVNSNGVTNGSSPYQSVGGISDSYHVNNNFSVHTTPPTWDYSSKPHPLLKTQVLEGEIYKPEKKILSSSSPIPTKVGHSSPARRVRISEPSPHDDYISRLENLQQRLSGMDSGVNDIRLGSGFDNHALGTTRMSRPLDNLYGA